jgi:hypothetical protein
MSEIYQRPSKTVEIDGTEYKITAYDAMTGLDYQFKVASPSPQLIQEMIAKGVTLNSLAIDPKKFSQLFSGRLPHLMKLYGEVLEFNFTDPLDVSDSEEL